MTSINQKQRTFISWALLSYALIAILLVVFEQVLERHFHDRHAQELQTQTARELNILAAELGGVINSNLSLLQGLAAHIAIHPDINQAEFENYASALAFQQPLFVSIAAAPNMVVTLIYPLESNRNVLGLDYTQSTDQWAGMDSLKHPGQTLLAGPLELVQGGEGLISHSPVFTLDGRFWGIISAPIRTPDLYQLAGLNEDNPLIETAIRGRNGTGQAGEVFYGNPRLFEDQRNPQITLPVGDGAWQMVAQPTSGWAVASATIPVLRGATLGILLLLTLLTLYRYRQRQQEYQFQQALEANEALLQEVGKIALVGGWQITIRHGEMVFTYWNEQTALILGLPADNQPPTLSRALKQFNEKQAEKLYQAIAEATYGAPFDMELSLTREIQPSRWVRIIGKPILQREEPFSVLGSVQDITERKRFTNKIQHQAIYDHLTGLPNRMLLDNRLTKSINKATREESQLAILFIDLDNFKPVNDNMGHSAGDDLLRDVAKRIQQTIRRSDTVGRYSGDEFVVILEDVRSSKMPVAVAEHILDVLKKPYVINDKEIFCSASIGISLFPQDGDTADLLISNADQAMYEVKRAGRNGWQFFTKNLQAVSEKRHQLNTQLITAINNRDFQVFYQPIIDLTDNRVRKCEALVRWFHNGKLVPTDEFISLAEETGRINEIDRFVLATASEFLMHLQQQYRYSVGLSVNVSPRVFTTKDNSLERWLALITKAANELSLTVEITERLLIEESDRLMWVLTKLKALGVSIAIDDFGTGYSSLSYLTRFPIDIVKIDQSFIKKLGLEHASEALTETMIQLSHKLSIEVVAEGVETQGQLDYLKRWQCDFGQGYYFDRPLNSEDFSKLIEQQSKQ